MRLSLCILACLVLSGCTGKQSVPSAPVPEPVPVNQTTSEFGNKQDNADSKIASSIHVARNANANGKPNVVEAELSVAASMLPKPAEGDLAIATNRAQAADPKLYQDAIATGQRLSKELESLWAKMETQQSKSAQEIKTLRQQIDDRQMALEQERKDKASAMLGMIGAGMLAVGVGLLAFGHFIGIGKINALSVILGGILVASLPWVFDSSYFPWVMGITMSGIAIEVMIVIWRKLLSRNAEVETPTTKNPDNPDNADGNS